MDRSDKIWSLSPKRRFFAFLGKGEDFEDLGAVTRQRKVEGACLSAKATGSPTRSGQILDRYV
ncbi:hypothetical protein BKP35_02130 [Anaerobacillus arseniciselenatis]|uniref:Uncharacterized protein n=1 Tax=Anaerobacillus arseniciselenatis TaxID=85682 RepID=A0A1S2LTG5_9BACI|nr:hypothetical protein BKP35_02130 [Anaerobacillus arseniciselenatis]